MNRCEICEHFGPLMIEDDYLPSTHGLCGRALHISRLVDDAPMVVEDASHYSAELYVDKNHCCKEFRRKK